jgi:hypothetical protein
MRSNIIKAAFAAASLFSLAGCAGNPLVGTWTAQQMGGGLNATITLTLNADGTASTNIQVMGGSFMGTDVTCTGPGVTNTGYRWTSTATTISVTGTPMCSGSSTCMVGGMSTEFGCSQMMGMGMGMGSNNLETAMYTLSNNNNTLTITTMSNGMTSMTTFMRRM